MSTFYREGLSIPWVHKDCCRKYVPQSTGILETCDFAQRTWNVRVRIHNIGGLGAIHEDKLVLRKARH